MIPILYDKDETLFTTNGICRLRDAISCEVTEERNSVYECVFTYPVNGANYDKIIPGRIIGVKHDDTNDIQPFDIVSFDKPINGVVTFYAVHISYRLKGMVAEGTEVGTLADALEVLETATPSSPFTYEADFESTAYAGAFDGVPKTVRQYLGGVEGSILDTYGGEYEWDKFNVILHKERGSHLDFVIRYGVNMLDYNETLDFADSYTSCIPYWIGDDGNGGQMLVKGDKVDPELIPYNGIEKCIPLDLSDKFDVAPSPTDLETLAESMMESRDVNLPKQSIRVDFVRLEDFGEYEQFKSLLKCKLCDSIDVIFPDYNTSGTFKIVKTVYDVLEERFSSMELGTLSTTLAEALGIGESSSTFTGSGGGQSGTPIYYGVCSTGQGTKAKTVTVTPNLEELTTGTLIFVKFTASNTATNPTLNVNGLGAHPIYRYGTTVPSTSTASSWNAGNVFALIYDGTGWQMVGWINTTYSSMTVAEYQAGTGTTARVITPARLKGAIQYWATGEENVLEGVQLDGTDLTITNKKVNIPLASTTDPGAMSSADKTKLNGIETGAEVNVNADWNATSGDAQILNKPTIPTATSDLTNDSGFISSETDPIFTQSPAYGITTQDIAKWNTAEPNVNADWNATSGDAEILNKPNIPTATSELTNDSGFVTYLDLADNYTTSTCILVVNGNTATLYSGTSPLEFVPFVNMYMSVAGLTIAQVLNGATDISQANARLYEVTDIDMTTASVRLSSVDDGVVYNVELQDVGNGLIGTITTETIPTDASEIGLSSSAFQQTIYDGDADVEEAFLTTDQIIAQIQGGYVPNSRTVNGKALSSNISIYAGDIYYDSSEQDTIASYLSSLDDDIADLQADMPSKTTAVSDGGYLFNGQTVDTKIGGTGLSDSTNFLTSTSNTYVALRSNTSNPFLGLKCGTNLWYAQAQGSYFYFGPTSTKAMRLDQNGSALFVDTVQANGNLTLYTPSGNSPGIIFQRGTLTDNYNDWKIYDKSGYLYFAQRGSGSTDFTDVGYISTSGVLTNFSIPWSSVTGKPTIPDDISDLNNDQLYDLGTITPSSMVFQVTSQQVADIVAMWGRGYCGLKATVNGDEFYAFKEQIITYNGIQLYGFVGRHANLTSNSSVLIGIAETPEMGMFADVGDLTLGDVQSQVESTVFYNGYVSTSNAQLGNITVGGMSYDIYSNVPAVSSADDGKVLRVVNGQWSAVNLPSANGGSF